MSLHKRWRRGKKIHTMINQIRILTLLIIGLLIFNSCSVYKTETNVHWIGNIDYQNIYIKTNNYEGVIFSKEYVGMLNGFKDKYTPSLGDIDSIEIILRQGIKMINKNKINQVDNCPIIHRNLNNYYRQYFGYIDSNGDKVIFINCLWSKIGFIDKINKEPIDTTWRYEEKIVMDGCSYYWSIKVNLTKKLLFDFGVNGLG
jgi:hypothetical protein